MECATTIKFERIFSDDDYAGLKDLMGAFDFDQPTLNADEAQEKLEQPSNESGQYQIPHWSDWNQERQEAFKKIAGDYLDNYDYTW